MKRAVTLLAISVFALGATPALAAAPSNDTIAGATAITTLPFSGSGDTSEATMDADELVAAAPCEALGAPAIEKAVWYAYTASAAATLLVETSASDYATGIAIYDGAPSAATFVTCSPAMLTTSVAAGQTVYLMVFGSEPGSLGGTVRITVLEAPPPPEVAFTVDEIATFDPRSGAATIGGTYTCSGVVRYAEIDGDVSQAVGRFTINGFFRAPLTCDGSSHTWTAQVTSMNGKFKGGQATVEATAFACGPVGSCGISSVTQRVRLRS